MTRKLQIIHLEDNIFSASLIQALLADEGFVGDIMRVETEEDFCILLERGGFDVVLAELTFPAFSGMTALTLTRERYPHLPFIFVTGTVGEEVAIECLKSGATDYVLKGRLSRLALALRRALQETEDHEKRLCAEVSQWESKKLFRNAFENSVNGMCLTEPNGRFLTVNDSLCEMLGYTTRELTCMTFLDLTHPDDAAPSRRLAGEMLTGGISVGNLGKRFLHKDGRVVWTMMSSFLQRDEDGSPLYFVTQIQNITEQKNLENQLRHAQKMEALGTLAGGIAHDFNNFLTVIVGYGNLLTKKLPKDNLLHHYLLKILTAADQAASLTKGLLAYSRKGPVNLHPVDLNDIIRKVDRLLTRIIGEDISLIVLPTDSKLSLLADEGQIEQILMNLASNARDAMQGRGNLLIEVNRTSIDAGFIAIHGYGREGDYALISVSDNGTGMDEAVQARIFEPFYTTKEVGKGTGLGLAIVYGIVKQHNGFVNMYSEPGKGTTFRIYLPLTDRTPDSQHRCEELPVRGNGETILLIEDSKEIRTVFRTMLKEYGYRVIDAADGEIGVEKYKSHQAEIDLLLLDIIMPRKNGRETFNAIRFLNPDVEALFMSGYAADVISHKGIDTEGLELLTKPFSPFLLLRKIRDMLDRQKT
jgi:PAS domain S-box-containing protein